MKKILLAYSGGLDTSVILAWLKETYGVPVVAYVGDLGQREDLANVRAKALRTGAAKCIVDDLREEFARDYIFPAIRANAVYEGVYLLGTALARPVLVQGMVRAARAEGCDAISHGATGKGNDQLRFEFGVKALAPDLEIIAPWREWDLTSRSSLFEYASKRGIQVPVGVEKPYSMDANLMHISYEGGILEDPWNEPPEEMFRWTTSPEKAPDEPESVEIEFQRGNPVAINGRKRSPARLVEESNSIGARHGVGRVDCVENRAIGIKSRGVYETPGVTLLMTAHRAVESITLDREISHRKDEVIPRFAELVYSGLWFSPEREWLSRCIDSTQQVVNGTARLTVFKGTARVTGRKSPNSLYSVSQASFDTGLEITPRDATGFINVQSLRLLSWARAHGSAAESNGRPRVPARGRRKSETR